MHSISSTNTHHDVIDLVNHDIVKNTKNLNISRTEHNLDGTFWEVIVLQRR